ncbi:MAG: hypothetical protein JSR47_17185 [Proteobacteria bacterium]|nr:hypothetical protein [Pseudomonadota bacterium]MBS0546837.1 hypothetical protein [Pseudomonadota bacterium]
MTAGWRSLLLWSAVATIVALIGVSFVLWGLNGPAYLIDLFEAYCT